MRLSFLTMAFVAACSSSSSEPELNCASDGGAGVEYRASGNLKGACNVDTEHEVFAQNACFFNSGVRAYTTNDDPTAVQQECRAGLQALVQAFCAKFPDENSWQASWVAFKPDGTPLMGSNGMLGKCTPFQITDDKWAVEIQHL